MDTQSKWEAKQALKLMSDISKLIDMLKSLDAQLGVCSRCGMCQAVCPLYAQTGNEADVARGKLAMLDGLIQKIIDDPGDVTERLNRCLLCGSCENSCSSGVNVLEIFLAARNILAGYQGLSRTKRVIFRKILSHPATFDRLLEWGAKFQHLFIKPADTLLNTSCARIVSPLLADRHFKPLSPEPFHHLSPALDSPSGKSGLKVAFFPGCLLDKIYPGIAEDTVSVLQHHEVGIFMPPGQGCCGIPAVSSGDPETFERLVRHNVELFNTGSFDYLVTACATCTFTIKKIWPMMVKSGSAQFIESVSQLSEKTKDISEFLVSVLGIHDSPAGSSEKTAPAEKAVKVTYHDPCHLKKSLGVSSEPRSLVQANPDYLLVEMNEADKCCGMGGSFNVLHYSLSADIGRQKVENVAATGCSTVATGCPACMMQLSDFLSKSDSSVSVKHVIEIYADALGKK
jgi:glycolate oxidase iron-sulfur subunit